MNETPTTTPAKKGRGIGFWSLVVGMLVLLIAMVLPKFVKVRHTSAYNACINNLRQIDSAIQQWALETGKTDTNSIDRAAIAGYINGRILPTCPEGGTYTLSPTVGTIPSITCSQTGAVHRLP